MQNKSWEIVIAGLILLFVAIYITANKPDEKSGSTHSEQRVAVSVSGQPNTTNSAVQVIDLNEIEHLEDLKELEQLSSLESLKSLRSLSSVIPEQARENLLAEINRAINELDVDTSQIHLDFSDGMLVINKEYDIVSESWSAVSPGVYAYMKEFDAPSLKKSTISIPAGSIEIVGTNDTRGKLVVKASGQIGSEEELSKLINANIVIEEDEAIFNFESAIDEAKNNVQLQATLTVPSGMDIYSVTKAGHISVININGDQTYKTLGGHLKLKNLTGDVKAFTEGGHIEILNSNGELILESLGGHLSARDCQGDLTLKTSGGNIEVVGARGDLFANTGGGNIDLDLRQVSGDVEATTGAGALVLLIPTGSDLDLNARATTIKLAEGFSFTGEKSKGRMTGKIGSGGSDFDLKTSYGTITIRNND